MEGIGYKAMTHTATGPALRRALRRAVARQSIPPRSPVAGESFLYRSKMTSTQMAPSAPAASQLCAPRTLSGYNTRLASQSASAIFYGARCFVAVRFMRCE